MEDCTGQFKGKLRHAFVSFAHILSTRAQFHGSTPDAQTAPGTGAQEENALVKVAFSLSHHLFLDSDKVLSRSKK